MNHINKNRVKKEMKMLSCAPPSGISCASVDDRLDLLSAQIIGEDGTPFEGGVFHLEIQVPDRYPFDPPRVRFVTPIYHPNIDSNGRICLDTLKLPPKGSWRPCLNLSTVLMMIRILMAEPGSEDPLMTAIWQEYKYNYTVYVEKARQWTQRHATASCVNSKTNSMLQTSTKTSAPTGERTAAPKPTCAVKHGQVRDQVSQPANNTNSKPESSSGTKLNSKKGLGLSTKRHALEECNINTKSTKML